MADSKVRHDERQQESERNAVRRMERDEERNGEAMAAKKAREQGKAESLRVLKEQTKVAAPRHGEKAWADNRPANVSKKVFFTREQVPCSLPNQAREISLCLPLRVK